MKGMSQSAPKQVGCAVSSCALRKPPFNNTAMAATFALDRPCAYRAHVPDPSPSLRISTWIYGPDVWQIESIPGELVLVPMSGLVAEIPGRMEKREYQIPCSRGQIHTPPSPPSYSMVAKPNHACLIHCRLQIPHVCVLPRTGGAPAVADWSKTAPHLTACTTCQAQLETKATHEAAPHAPVSCTCRARRAWVPWINVLSDTWTHEANAKLPPPNYGKMVPLIQSSNEIPSLLCTVQSPQDCSAGQAPAAR